MFGVEIKTEISISIESKKLKQQQQQLKKIIIIIKFLYIILND
jgi:hypothetical protein